MTLGAALAVTAPVRAQGPVRTPGANNALSQVRAVVADTAVAVIPIDTAIPSPPSPIIREMFGPLEQVTHALWPGVPVSPNMETGATDGLYLRNAGMPVYGVSGVFLDADDIRADGRDERMGVREFHQGRRVHLPADESARGGY